jgi:hypothetical protein
MNAHDENKVTDERLARDAQRLLRQSADELDAHTLSRLNRARQHALAEYDRHGTRPSTLRGWQAGLGAVAVCATAFVAVALWVGRVPGPVPPGPEAATPLSVGTEPASDLEVVLVEDENPEMIENLEFYDWLDPDPAADDAPQPGLSG